MGIGKKNIKITLNAKLGTVCARYRRVQNFEVKGTDESIKQNSKS